MYVFSCTVPVTPARVPCCTRPCPSPPPSPRVRSLSFRGHREFPGEREIGERQTDSVSPPVRAYSQDRMPCKPPPSPSIPLSFSSALQLSLRRSLDARTPLISSISSRSDPRPAGLRRGRGVQMHAPRRSSALILLRQR